MLHVRAMAPVLEPNEVTDEMPNGFRMDPVSSGPLVLIPRQKLLCPLPAAGRRGQEPRAVLRRVWSRTQVLRP